MTSAIFSRKAVLLTWTVFIESVLSNAHTSSFKKLSQLLSIILPSCDHHLISKSFAFGSLWLLGVHFCKIFIKHFEKSGYSKTLRLGLLWSSLVSFFPKEFSHLLRMLLPILSWKLSKKNNNNNNISYLYNDLTFASSVWFLYWWGQDNSLYLWSYNMSKILFFGAFSMFINIDIYFRISSHNFMLA